MYLVDLMNEKKLTMYRLSKLSGIPYSTISDICSGKTLLEKSSAETVYKLAKALNMSMEDLLSPILENRPDFELFKSNVCHHLKTLGDINFVIETLENNEIRRYYRMKCYLESFYLLGMLDYVSNENNIPLCNDYDDLRTQKLSKPVYPTSVITASIVTKSQEPKNKALENAIPEFKRFNIIENEVRNVV